MVHKKFKLLCEKDLLEKEMREKQTYEREKRSEELKFLKLQEENMRKFL